MPRATLEGLVLEKSPGGESHLRLQVLCGETGLRLLMQRAATRKGGPPSADLFDFGTFEIDEKEDGLGFVRDVEIQKRHAALAREYASLEKACRLARVVVLNRPGSGHARALLELVLRALAAFETGVRPECTYLKSLYVLLRGEGYPVREDWAAGLGEGSLRDFELVINTPLASQTVPQDRVLGLIRKLETWARVGAELRFPE